MTKNLNLICLMLCRNILLRVLVTGLICYSKDSLELCLVREEFNNDEDDEVNEHTHLLEAQPYIQP